MAWFGKCLRPRPWTPAERCASEIQPRPAGFAAQQQAPSLPANALIDMKKRNGHWGPGVRSAFLFLLGFLLLLSTGPALADKRVALVVGISKYQHVPQLTNPARDADAVAALLKQAGFDVVNNQRDLGIVDLRRVIREFSETSRDADIAVVYYAGHGIEVDGTNYLVPADAKLASDFDIEDETISLDRVLKALEGTRRLQLVILDACRDNPFSNTMKRSVASRSIGRGLAKIEPTMSDTLVAFAAKAGAVASDGDGQQQPVRGGAGEIHRRARARSAARIRPRARRRAEEHRQPPGAVRLRLARRPNHVAGSARRQTRRSGSAKHGSITNSPPRSAPRKPGIPSSPAIRTAFTPILRGRRTTSWPQRSSPAPKRTMRGGRPRSRPPRRPRSCASSWKSKASRQTAEAKQKLSEQAKKDLEEARRQVAEQTKKELDEAQRQVELAQQQAEAARQQVEEAKRQAIAEAQRQVEQAKASRPKPTGKPTSSRR